MTAFPWISQRNLETLVFVLFFIRLLLLVPDDWIVFACGAGAALSVAALYGIRAYLRRLEGVAKRLKTEPGENGVPASALHLSAPERALLGLGGGAQDATSQLSLLRRKQGVIRKFGEFIGIMGMCAFAVLLVFLGED